MSLYDFYMYLKYIELSAENLEFYVWYVTPACSSLPLPNDLLKVQELRARSLDSVSRCSKSVDPCFVDERLR